MNYENFKIPIIESMSDLAGRYDVWLTDIWGVMHNGITPFAPAAKACQLFRQGGGTVILISNSPRPNDTAALQLREVGVPEGCYDAIATSGDVTQKLISDYAGQTVFHLGPKRDLPIFDGLGVELGEISESAVVVCSGFYNDESETPEDYAKLLNEIKTRKLPMICANPDIKVERGNKLIFCAGALAEAYGQIGGEVIYAGKPHPPIYDLALAHAQQIRGGKIARNRVLAIGDGLRTDIAGAASQQIDCVFIASAVHVAGGAAGLDATSLSKLFRENPARPIAAMSQLNW